LKTPRRKRGDPEPARRLRRRGSAFARIRSLAGREPPFEAGAGEDGAQEARRP
jgi:hypothetical protein